MKKQQKKLITTDKGMSGKGKQLTEADLKIMESAANPDEAERVPIESAEQLIEMAKQAHARFGDFKEEYTKIMDANLAAFIRKKRVNEGYSWRAVAQACFDKYPPIQYWQSPPSNQLAGMAACELAAQHFGEHYKDSLWNK